MGFARGKFGIEYDDRPRPDGDGHALPWILGAVALVAAVSLVVTVRNRMRRNAEDEAAERAAAVREVAAARTAAVPEAKKAAAPAVAPPAPSSLVVPAAERRSTKVRTLLMRLEAAERARDAAMAVSAIEQLRRLPDAADLDDALARRLGTLNLRLLFSKAGTPWVTEVVVRRGDAAERIARERGSTYASLVRLNPGVNLGALRVGQKLRVMKHPRFTLAVRRKAQTADLSLNGKFFKRYYLAAPVTGAPGACETPARMRAFWRERGLPFKPDDRVELEMLLPTGTSVLVSEY